ncbi:MAG: ABC transporter ATP-binding protein, partial [Acidimicrobiales bacterium]
TPGRPVLELARLSSGWRGVAVVHDVDLVVGEGEVVALLGANGAGKTTTLLTAAGVLPALGGTIRVEGEAVVARPHRMVRRGVALAPQDRGVLAGLTVGEQLRLAAGPGRTGRSAAAGALDRLPALRPLLARRAGLLSGGEQQQVALARAVASRPRLLLVDELSLGLAPLLIDEALKTLRALADSGMAVLVVEQFAPVVLGVADRAYVLRQGRVVVSAAASELVADPEALEAAYLGERPGDIPRQ